MRAKEAMLRNFFQNVEACLRDCNISTRPMHMQPDDLALLQQIQEAQAQVGRGGGICAGRDGAAVMLFRRLGSGCLSWRRSCLSRCRRHTFVSRH
jgi:hypothetical protein